MDPIIQCLDPHKRIGMVFADTPLDGPTWSSAGLSVTTIMQTRFLDSLKEQTGAPYELFRTQLATGHCRCLNCIILRTCHEETQMLQIVMSQIVLFAYVDGVSMRFERSYLNHVG